MMMNDDVEHRGRRLRVAALLSDVLCTDGGFYVDSFYVVGPDGGPALFVRGIPELFLADDPVNLFR